MRYFLLALFLGCSIFAFGQKGQVVQEAKEIEGLRRQGLGLLVEYDKKTVDKAWNKLLKSIGKVDTWKGGALVVLEANVANADFAGADHITRLDATTEGTKVFWSIGQKGEYAQPGSALYEKARKTLADFAKQLYRDDLADQIEAAEKVADVVSRTHDKTVQMGEHLRKQLERNATDQTNLLKNLEEKKTEAERLKAELSQNKIDQETALEEIKKVRKVAEEKKRKLTIEN